MQTKSPEITEISLESIIVPDPLNGRIEISDDQVNSLAHNIQTIGLIHPITVRPKDGNYELIAGNHRFLAIQKLGSATISAIIIKCDDNMAMLTRLSENAARTNVTPVEEAKQLHLLVENDINGVEGVALKIGRPINWILNRLEIMSWPGILMEYVHSNKISLSAAKRLAHIKPETLQTSYIHDAADNGINTRTASLWLQQSRSQVPQNFEPSENTRNDPILEYETSTKVNCFVCSEMTLLEKTHAIRICSNCVQAIHVKKEEIENPHHKGVQDERENV